MPLNYSVDIAKGKENRQIIEFPLDYEKLQPNIVNATEFNTLVHIVAALRSPNLKNQDAELKFGTFFAGQSVYLYFLMLKIYHIS